MSFFRILVCDLRRAIISKLFILSVLLVVCFYILGTLDTILECIKYGSEITVLDLHSAATFSTFSLLNYVICAIPYANGFASEYKSNYFRSVLVRSNRRYYALSKVISTAFSGVLCLVFGELLFIMICSFFGEAIDINTIAELKHNGTEAFSNISNAEMLVKGDYFGYFLVLSVHRGLIGSFLSLLALGVSLKIQNIFVIVSSPMLLYYFVQNLFVDYLKLPQYFNIANIFDGAVSITDSRYMFWYALIFALLFSLLLGAFIVKGIERKLLNG